MLTPEKLKPLAKESEIESTHRIDLDPSIMSVPKLMRVMSHIWDYLEFYVGNEHQLTYTKGQFWRKLHEKMNDDPATVSLSRHELTCEVFIQSESWDDGTPMPMFIYQFQM